MMPIQYINLAWYVTLVIFSINIHLYSRNIKIKLITLENSMQLHYYKITVELSKLLPSTILYKDTLES